MQALELGADFADSLDEEGECLVNRDVEFGLGGLIF
jgi:hypothetical protein